MNFLCETKSRSVGSALKVLAKSGFVKIQSNGMKMAWSISYFIYILDDF